MAELIEMKSKRLCLRQWKATDCGPFAALNSDPRVMEFFPSPLTRTESDAMADRYQLLIEERGWGFWAVESKNTYEFIGLIGLHTPSSGLPFSPCIEVGWRLAFQHWGKGFASEGAKEALRVGFNVRFERDRLLHDRRQFQVACSNETSRHERVRDFRASSNTRRQRVATTLFVPSIEEQL